MEVLTNEKFQEIYTNEKLRNAVAFAHGCLDSNHVFKHYKANLWPNPYTVTPEQIAKAKEERERAKKELISSLGNKLVFVGMGMQYDPRYKGDPGNHRIRTYIINGKGREFFIEVGTGQGDLMRIDFAINETLRARYKNSVKDQSEYYNWHGLERERRYRELKYTKENILNLVNLHFVCKFEELIVDYYTLSPDDYKSISK